MMDVCKHGGKVPQTVKSGDKRTKEEQRLLFKYTVKTPRITIYIHHRSV